MSQVVGELTEKLNYESHESFANFEKTKESKHCCTDKRLVQSNQTMVERKKKSFIQVQKRWEVKSIAVHILIITFGVSAWIGVNGIFIQLPLLVNYLPESWGLAAHLVIIIQAANISPVIYSLLRKSSFQMNEFTCITIMLGVGSLVMGIMSFLYDTTLSIFGHQHSVALFVLTFFTAAVSCTSSVLFMPYLRNFQEIYLVSYFIGEGLGGVLPSVVALIQGVGESSSCKNSSNNISNDAEIFEKISPRFTSQTYFTFIFICLLCSLTAFLLLENLSCIQQEKNFKKESDNKSFKSIETDCHCQEKISVLPHSSISEYDKMEIHVCSDDLKKTDDEELSSVYYKQNKNFFDSDNLNLFILLGVICLLAHGLLPSIQPYSCLSYGSVSYHLSVTFSQIANPTACLLALWYLPQNKKIIYLLALVISIVSSYIFYLAYSSPNPPLKNSKIGKSLVILSWTMLLGFISYVKLIITAVFRRKCEKKLFHVGVVMQIGSVCGAVLSFILINCTSFFREYESC